MINLQSIPLHTKVLGSLTILFFCLPVCKPILMLIAKNFVLDRYKVYRISVGLNIARFIILGLLILGWAFYAK
jgi:hypothetical protein